MSLRHKPFGAVLIDLTVQQCILRLCAVVIIAAVHGAAISAAACALGDQGPRHDGRLSLNPLVHLDILGTVSGILFSIGWIKPLAVDPDELRLPRLGLIVILAAGLAATLLTVMLLRLVRPAILPLLPDTASEIAFAIIETIGQIGLWFALVNTLPVPCLTGGHILMALVPQWRRAFVRSQPYAAIVLIVLIASGLITDLLGGAHHALARLLLGD